MFVRTFISFIMICFCLVNISSITIIPERTSITYVNPKYFTNVTMNVRRSSRRGEYVINMIGASLVTFGNNISLHVVLFEHRAVYNQYIPTFIEFHYKLCDMIRDDPIFGAILRKLGGAECPIAPRSVKWMNITITADLPFPIPFTKGKGEGKLKDDATNELVASAEVFFHIKPIKHGI